MCGLNQIPYDYTVEIQGIRSDNVPEELWMEVCDIVQEAGKGKSRPKEKKCKMAKTLQIAVKRREVKGRGKIPAFECRGPRTARRYKKAFLRGQCKEIEKNNRMGKTRGLFKKIRDNKGAFQAKMGTIKDRNGMDLTEAEDIKKR